MELCLCDPTSTLRIAQSRGKVAWSIADLGVDQTETDPCRTRSAHARLMHKQGLHFLNGEI